MSLDYAIVGAPSITKVVRALIFIGKPAYRQAGANNGIGNQDDKRVYAKK